MGFACVENLPGAGGDYLSLREKPSVESGELARLTPGTALEIIGGEAEWVNVQTLDRSANSGWVEGRFLAPVDDPAACLRLWAKPETKGEAASATGKPERAAFACVGNLKEGDFLTLREKPSADSGAMDHLLADTVLIIGSKGNWVHVEVLDGAPRSG